MVLVAVGDEDEETGLTIMYVQFCTSKQGPA